MKVLQLLKLQNFEFYNTLCQVTYQEMVENEVKDTQKGPTRKLITESCKSNSMVIKVIVIFPLFLLS